MVPRTVWTYEEKLVGPVGIPTSNRKARSIFTTLTELSRLFNVKCAIYITGYGWGLEHTDTEYGPVPYFCEDHKERQFLIHWGYYNLHPPALLRRSVFELLPQILGYHPRSVHIGFVVKEVKRWKIFLLVLSFLSSTSFHHFFALILSFITKAI
jgi:hypothetical protein